MNNPILLLVISQIKSRSFNLIKVKKDELTCQLPISFDNSL